MDRSVAIGHTTTKERLEAATGWNIDATSARSPQPVDIEELNEGVWRLRVSSPGAERLALVVPCALDEHFVGLGEQFIQVDKRGRIFDGFVNASVNSPLPFNAGLDGGYKPAPLWYSSAGYGAVVETFRRVRVEFAVRHPLQVVVELPGDELSLVIVDGMPAEAVPKITEVIGRPPLAPPWAYGVWKEFRSGHEAVLEQAARLRELRIGASAIWFYTYYEKETNSGFPASGTYPRGEFADLSQTVGELHALGFRALTYVTPYLYRDTPIGEEGIAKGYGLADVDGNPLYVPMMHPISGDDFGLLAKATFTSRNDACAIIDFTNPEARTWWQGIVRKILLEQDFDGWMEDFEPNIPKEAVPFDGSSPEELHNRYGVLYHGAAFEEVRRSKPDAVFFARGGWLIQAVSPALWPGDQSRDWSSSCGLGCVVPAGISFGLQGVAAWGPDIAGPMGYLGFPFPFAGGSEDKELWLRWCQLGAMSPVMRDHLGYHRGTPVDMWTDEETTDCWRRCADWHIRLFPHLWSAAHETSATGLPIVRGLMIEFPADPLSWALTDEYLLGDALLCAPVLDKGARTRRVYLPTGEWVDVWTGERHVGPGFVEVPAPIDRWPVLQRADRAVAQLAEGRLDLCDPALAQGRFDLEIRVADETGEARFAERQLFDGTRLRPTMKGLEATNPFARRVRVTTADGRILASGEGETVELDYR